MTNEDIKEIITQIRRGDEAWPDEDLIEVIKWFDSRYTELKNDAITRIADISIKAMETLKATL